MPCAVHGRTSRTRQVAVAVSAALVAGGPSAHPVGFVARHEATCREPVHELVGPTPPPRVDTPPPSRAHLGAAVPQAGQAALQHDLHGHFSDTPSSGIGPGSNVNGVPSGPVPITLTLVR